MVKRTTNHFKTMAGSLGSYPVTTLQANLGRLCNLSCNHCHLAASPQSEDIMPWAVMQDIIRVMGQGDITTIDITGGAPELNPDLKRFIDGLYGSGVRIQLRTNLVALLEPPQKGLAEFLRNKEVTLVASLPCYQEANVRAQRGDEVFNRSISALKLLNRLGYGAEKGLELDLVYNPGGPFLPGPQEDLEILYRRELQLRYGLVFNRLLVLTNMPLGRFKNMLSRDGMLTDYFELLRCAYNKDNLSRLMCRNQISVGWDGTLYDCDFNLALGQPVEGEITRIADFDRHYLGSRLIVTGEHCFGCTAGAGSSCRGSLKASGS